MTLQGPGRGITMRDGTLVFPIQYIGTDRIPNAGIIYSKDHAGLLVHQHRRIPDAVLRLRKTAPFAQIHNHAHLIPSTAGVNASAYANVNVALQILA